MSTRRRPAIAAVMLVVSLIAGLSAPAAAQGTGQGPALPKEVKAGKTLWIVTADGADRRGRIDSITAEEIVLLVRNQPTTIRIADVRRIDAKDSLQNGGLIGATVFGLMFGGMLAQPGFTAGGGGVGYFFSGFAVGAGLGALFGVAVDAAIPGRRTIYSAPPPAAFVVRPLVSGRGAGLGVTIRW